MPNNKKSYKLQNKVRQLDAFGQAFNFKLPGGNDTEKSMTGACLSILMLVILILYGSFQMQLLSVYGETVVTMSVRDSHYDSDFAISSEIGLKFAVAIIEYDGNPEPIDDPRYG